MKISLLGLLLLIFPFVLNAEEADKSPLDQEVIKLDGGELIFRRIDPSKYDKKLDGFFLLESEVTNQMFARYLREAGKVKEDWKWWREEKSRREKGIHGHTASTVYDVDNEDLLWQENTPPKGRGNYPVAFIRHADAEAYCAWLSKRHSVLGVFRLPTKHEWLVAAYGRNRKFPWGDQKDLSIPCVSLSYDKMRKTPVSVKQPTKDVTPEGIRHIWGNVREYIQAPGKGDDVYWMGASFKTYPRDDGWPLKPSQDYWGFVHSPDSRLESVGFRVVLVPKQKP